VNQPVIFPRPVNPLHPIGQAGKDKCGTERSLWKKTANVKHSFTCKLLWCKVKDIPFWGPNTMEIWSSSHSSPCRHPMWNEWWQQCSCRKWERQGLRENANEVDSLSCHKKHVTQLIKWLINHSLYFLSTHSAKLYPGSCVQGLSSLSKAV